MKYTIKINNNKLPNSTTILDYEIFFFNNRYDYSDNAQIETMCDNFLTKPENTVINYLDLCLILLNIYSTI